MYGSISKACHSIQKPKSDLEIAMASTVLSLYIFNIRQNSRIYWLHRPLGINLAAFVSRPICLTPLTSNNLLFNSPLLHYFQPVSLCILLLNTCKTLTIFLGNITFSDSEPISFLSLSRTRSSLPLAPYPPFSVLLKAVRVCCFTQSCV